MYYHNNELPPQQGWICPKCGRVNAPWMPTCGCVSSQTSGTPYLVKTSSISRDSHEIAKDEPTGYNLSPFDKDINVRSKTEPPTCDTCKYADKEWYEEPCDRCGYMGRHEPQTERSE